MASLLAEIPTWDDHLLTHMYKRFATSRLFRIHHEADGELTDRAQTLLARAGAELAERGLPIPDLTSDGEES
ncbi:hypothetical protein [Pelagibacterium xiamenense]|uniref:hypothetical protein n=1 Tax=Pelagibacterium xiamenense TaxID=2901140 RepID=UPI001E56B0E3|nr:hypothetical protein [Pelagibacterium xiamenense]MCD7060302.1 hypothetical protein [Pelagibacterium xiamenense]